MSAYRILRGLTNLAVLVVTILMLFTLQTASAAPEIQVWETQHGVPVYFVEAHEIPMVQVSMGFKAGSANDPTDKLGLSSLMSQMLTMGVEGMGQDSLAEAIESTGAQIGASSDADKVVASFKSLSEAGIFQKASELYLKNNNHHKATYQHQDRVSGVLTVESWIKEGDMDKSKMYGYNLPNGTWFVKMKIENEELWQKIKAGELKGLSIEGYFTDKFESMQNQQPTDQEILEALNEIINENQIKSK